MLCKKAVGVVFQNERQRCPNHGVGWCWQADEFVGLALVEVEFCKAQSRKSSLTIINAMADGATPKLMSSASESSSLPIAELTLSRRAAMPSKKSKTAAIRIKSPASVKLPVNAKVIDRHPDKAFIKVMVFGMLEIILFCAIVQLF